LTRNYLFSTEDERSHDEVLMPNGLPCSRPILQSLIAIYFLEIGMALNRLP
jgi:hypothetical protein